MRPGPLGLASQALLVLAAAGGLAWLFTHVAQRDWQPAQTDILLAGERYRVGLEELRWLEAFSSMHFGAGEAGAREVVAAQISAELDRMFAHAHERVPTFADWYYSLRGEYSRAAMSALALAQLAEPEYVARQAAAMLLPEDAWAAQFAKLERATEETLVAHRAAVRDGWLTVVSERLAGHRVPEPLPFAASQSAAPLTVELDGLIGRIGARENAALGTRLSLSTVAAGGAAAAGPALWRAAAARGSAAARSAVAARTAVRGATRAGSAATGGAVLCSPGGPLALGCALLTGAAVWIATDWALLAADERLNRADLVVALQSGLDALRHQMERDLLAAYDAAVVAQYGAVAEEIERSFVPARAGAAPR